MATEAAAAKKVLRKQVKTRLADLDPNQLDSQSNTARDLILSLPQYRAAKRISIYLSMPTGEVRTLGLISSALLQRKVFVPHLYSVGGKGDDSGRKRKEMTMLRLRSWEDYTKLEPDAWGIPSFPAHTVEARENAMGGLGVSPAAEGESNSDDEEVGLDIIVVPGVAFDADMGRLGHGAGFYDSYLSRHCRDEGKQKPFLLGLCLAEQFLPSGQIPMEDTDWRMDAVAVGDGRLVFASDLK